MTTKITREYLANSTIASLPFVAPNAANIVTTTNDPPEQGSLYFDGDSDTLTFSGFTGLGSGDFTVECWANTESVSSSRGLWDTRATNTSTAGLMLREDGTANVIVVNGSSTVLTGANVRLANTWQHMAVVRSSGTLSLYVDGTSVDSTSFSTNLTDTNFRLSGLVDSQNSTYAYKGRIGGLHVVPDAALYTDDFTPTSDSLQGFETGNVAISLAVPSNSPSYKSDASNSDISALVVTGARSTAFSPYNTSWSGYFDGSGDYLSTPSTNIISVGDGDEWTVEGWYYFGTSTSDQTLMYISGDTGTAGAIRLDFRYGNRLSILISTSSTTNATNQVIDTNQAPGSTYTGFVTNSTWYHIAAVRTGNRINIYLNGSWIFQSNVYATLKSGTINYIGALNYGSIIQYYQGYVSNFRVVDGTAVYTSAFTPPTSPLTAISGTTLLTCQSGRFIDNSTNNLTITAYGNSKTQNFSPFTDTDTSTGSIYFDGSGDLVELNKTASDLYIVGSKPNGETYNVWTWEAWIYPTATDFTIMQGASNTAGQLEWYYYHNSTNGLSLHYRNYGSSDRFAYSNQVLPLNQWSHVVAQKEDGEYNDAWYWYINGTRYSSALGNPYGPMAYGDVSLVNSSSTKWGTSGTFYMSDFRFTKAERYTGNPSTITVPTSPLTADSQTSLLTFQKRASDVGTFVDISQNKFITNNNGSVYLSSRSPYHTPGTEYSPTTHGTSMYFDGTGDNLTTPSSAAFALGSGSFTVEMWIYLSAINRQHSLLDLRSSAGNGWVFYVSDTNKLTAYDGSAVPQAATSLAANRWYHVAFVRSGSTLRFFLDGVQDLSTSNSRNNTTSVPATIGSSYDNAGYSHGYISNLRVVKGTAVYTSAFDPPTSPLTEVSGISLLLGGQLPYYDRSGTTTITPSNVSTSSSDPLQPSLSRYITINGRNFAPGVLLTLNNRYFANSVRIIDSTQLIAEIPGDVPVGTYDIYLVRPSGRFSIFPSGITLT